MAVSTATDKDKENGLFFRTWLRSPISMGSVIPSSRHLARAMAEVVADRPRATVVELGGGTGAITQGLLEHGVRPDNLIVVELDPKLHGYLAGRFPMLRVIRGDATKLTGILAEQGIDDVGAVISGIPLITMNEAFQRAIMTEAFAVLPENGFVTQYSYSPVNPPLRHKALNVDAKRVRYVLRNFPPASVWRITRGSGFARPNGVNGHARTDGRADGIIPNGHA